MLLRRVIISLMIFTVTIDSFSQKYPDTFMPGIISTNEYDSHPAFTPSGDTLFFIRCSADINTCSSIYVSYKRNQKWTNPVVATFSGKYYDADPFVTKDGKTIYFVSNRPLKDGDSLKADWDIWKSELTASGWTNPIHLDAPINSSADEYYPTLSDNGTMYFGSTRAAGKGGSDIYSSRLTDKRYASPENIGDSINTLDNEYEPFIAPDESYLIFMATVPKGLINADIFMSRNIGGKWSKAQKINSPINSNAIEWSPKVTRDKKYFFFGSTRNGLGDIYYVDFSALKLK